MLCIILFPMFFILPVHMIIFEARIDILLGILDILLEAFVYIFMKSYPNNWIVFLWIISSSRNRVNVTVSSFIKVTCTSCYENYRLSANNFLKVATIYQIPSAIIGEWRSTRLFVAILNAWSTAISSLSSID